MYRFALVGCGRIAKRHAELLGKGVIDGAELVGVCDVRTDRAQQLGLEHAVPWFDDMHTMMKAVEADVAVVLTESGSHAKHVIELSQHGCHVVVEKPMALTLDDADRMIRACDRAGSRLFVVKQNRFNPMIQQLRRAVDQGRFGKMVLGNFLNPEMLGWLESANRNGGAAAFRAESEILSLHHGEIGGIVAQHWQLPEPIVAGVIYHHAPEDSDDPIAYAVFLANLIAHGWADDEVDENDPEQPSPTATIVAALERLGISEAVYQGFGPMVRARLKLALAGYD